jgi:hypothetical protein
VLGQPMSAEVLVQDAYVVTSTSRFAMVDDDAECKLVKMDGEIF